MKKSVVKFRNFSFRYNSQRDYTLKNINLDIYEGERVLILGASGCGKSTLCSSINGIVPFFYSGQIEGYLEINGKKVCDLSIFEISKSVGTILQDPDNQFIGLTSAEDIAFKLENLCIDQKVMHKKVLETSKIVEMERFLNYNPQNLSGGQKQKVTLGGVIIDDVDILLFDEPLANLDPKSSEDIINLMSRISKGNKTLIVVEHRLEEILKLDLDRIILLDDGEIVFNGTSSELLCANILKNYGIREPLYVSALKYCGINIKDYLYSNDPDFKFISESVNNFCKSIESPLPKPITKPPILRCENISFSYDENKKVVNNVSFDLFDGEILCIVGKNGAGKSTISKLMCGFIKSSSGSFIFKGKDISNYAIYDRSKIIGYVMQNPNQMISHTTVFDEVAFALKNLKLSRNDITNRVSHIMKICGVYEFRNWPISALSFGQKRRVTISSILVMNPKIIILDEPTAGQDFKNYIQIMEFIKSLTLNGITVVIITHDMYLLMEYADRCIVMCDGIKIGDDIPLNILSNAEIVKESNLKQTSLHELGKTLNIDDKYFINKIISYDRSLRK